MIKILLTIALITNIASFRASDHHITQSIAILESNVGAMLVAMIPLAAGTWTLHSYSDGSRIVTCADI